MPTLKHYSFPHSILVSQLITFSISFFYFKLLKTIVQGDLSAIKLQFDGLSV